MTTGPKKNENPSKHEDDNTLLRISGLCTDTADGKNGKFGTNCAHYREFPSQCGDHDEVDFKAASVCCACGGGETGTLTLFQISKRG